MSDIYDLRFMIDDFYRPALERDSIVNRKS